MQSSSNIFIGFDLRDQHLSDKRVRQAIACAINKQYKLIAYTMEVQHLQHHLYLK